MFQAAIAALMVANIRPASGKEQWGHDFVQSQFSGVLIKRRKLYPSELASLLQESLDIRLIADYDAASITGKIAGRALQKARVFVATVCRRLL